MTKIVSVQLLDLPGHELVAEAVSDPQRAFAGGPLAIQRALRIRATAGGLEAQLWAEASDPLRPLVLPPNRIRGIGTPRRDAVTLFMEFWDRRNPKLGARPLPVVAIDTIAEPTTPIIVLEPAFRTGNVTALELIVLNRIVRSLRPLLSLEIGTFDGRSTLNIAANAPSDAVVVTLDLPRGQVDRTLNPIDPEERGFVDKAASGTRFIGTVYAERIRQIFGDSASFDFSPYEGAVDFVFVDASHAKANVMADAATALRLLRRGTGGAPKGFVLFHDYGGWEGVTSALEELAVTDSAFATLRSISETSFAFLDLTRTA